MKPFDSLAYNGQLSRLRRLARTALEHYGLQQANIKLLQYEDNAVYHVKARENEQFVLRISAAEGHGATEQRSELLWLRALKHDTDLLVPVPVPTVKGEYLITVEGIGVPAPRHCVLFRWVPGHIPTQKLSSAVVERIGEVTASLHQHAEHFVPPAWFVRPSWGWDRLFGPSSVVHTKRGASELTAYERNIVRRVGIRVQEEFKTLDCEATRWGLTHADLHRGNIIISQNNIGVIDFDDCGWGYYLLDVATMLSSLYRMVGDVRDYAMLQRAYITGYEKVRALPSQLDTQLPIFVVLRGMVIVNFVLGSRNPQVQKWGRTRISGILKQLDAYLSGYRLMSI